MQILIWKCFSSIRFSPGEGAGSFAADGLGVDVQGEEPSLKVDRDEGHLAGFSTY